MVPWLGRDGTVNRTDGRIEAVRSCQEWADLVIESCGTVQGGSVQVKVQVQVQVQCASVSRLLPRSISRTVGAGEVRASNYPAAGGGSCRCCRCCSTEQNSGSSCEKSQTDQTDMSRNAFKKPGDFTIRIRPLFRQPCLKEGLPALARATQLSERADALLASLADWQLLLCLTWAQSFPRLDRCL
jgi:hypothetical protein